MATLLWKNKKDTKSLAVTPFNTEEEFEKLVFETPEILEDIFLIKRQIRGGNKSGIPDIIGIDNDGNICILEMKNVEVDASIIPQVLQYAFWAEKNPDSIKSLWLECKDRPDELSVSWNELEIRIIVIAPSILSSTLDLVNKIDYAVDLIEVKRWVDGDNHMLLVNKLEPEVSKIKNKPVHGLETYDENFYKREKNNNSVTEFMKYTVDVDRLIKAKNWQLEMKYNKHYCGYKSGAFNAFGVKWIGSKTFAFFFKMSKEEASKFNIPMTRYEDLWKEASYYIDPGKTKVEDYLPLFEFAYKKLTGR